MTRGVHLVGSIPGDSARDAMDAALRRLGPYLRTLSDGETGVRSWWIRVALDGLRGHPQLALVRDGGYSSYEDTPQLRVKDGAELTAGSVEAYLVIREAFERSYPVFHELREAYGHPEVDFQVGVPSHLDLAIDAFGEGGLTPRIYEPCLEATARQIRAVNALEPPDVVFQVEMPVPLVAVATAGDRDQPSVAAQMADYAVELPARADPGTRFGIHLCLGDMNHKASGHMRDARPVVLLAMELARRWPAGRPLEFIHAPFGAADEPPPLGEQFYAPLSELDLPPEIRFAAGIVHERRSLAEERRVLLMIERLLGRQVDVAAACGLARRPNVNQAWDAMVEAAALVEA